MKYSKKLKNPGKGLNIHDRLNWVTYPGPTKTSSWENNVGNFSKNKIVKPARSTYKKLTAIFDNIPGGT